MTTREMGAGEGRAAVLIPLSMKTETKMYIVVAAAPEF